ncbi:hypothetical protein [Caballeronia glathei]|uniref:hypothetical protein n=1 Tax=Caballeronia glathei TaxID=60547 RepID=UPI000B0560AA|nr:hypothetical protein [Caballeronia glathei]
MKEAFVDDRFDRRALLLHLGDVLEAASRVTGFGRPNASIAQLARDEATLQQFAFLQSFTPTMTAAEFAGQVASAFCSWPAALLEERLDQRALAVAVQRHLFEDNARGWNTYAAELRKQVKWFAADLPKVKGERASAEPDANREKALAQAATSVEWGASDEKRGWPWPQPGSTS